MKKLSATLLSLTALVIIISSCSCSKKVDPPTDPTPTVGITVTNISQTSVDVTITATGYTNLSVTGPGGFSKSAPGTYPITGLTAGTSYILSGVVSNATKSASTSQSFTTLVATSIYTAVFTAVDASTSALLKSLPGNSVTKALVLNVTTPGFIKLETIGSLTNGNPAIGYWWITDRDSSEVFQSTSTLNPKFVKIAAAATQNINLAAGVNVICFKTAPYSGAVANGTPLGVKITGANNNTVSTSAYTADATSANATNVVKVFCKSANGKIDPSGQSTGDVWSILQIIPYSDENATVYDGNLYPSILSVSFDTKNTSWFTGVTTGYSNLDFTNSAGLAGRNLQMSQIDGTVTPVVQRDIFINSQATLSSGIITFSGSAVKMLKSNGGNFASVSTYTNVYNSGSVFGSANVSWYLKSIRFSGNPEIWIYDPLGNRIW